MNDSADSIVVEMSIVYGGDFIDDDPSDHEVRFCIKGLPQTETVAIVRTFAIKEPRIIRYLNRGQLELHQPLLDLIVLNCLAELLHELILLQCTTKTCELERRIDWLFKGMHSSEATLIEYAIDSLEKDQKPNE